MKTERQRLLEERKLQKKEHGHLFSEVSKLLFKIDPMGIAFEENFDEYDLEAGTILPRIKGIKEKEKVKAVVKEEFHKWFDLKGDDDLSDEIYESISDGIHTILSKTNPNEPKG